MFYSRRLQYRWMSNYSAKIKLLYVKNPRADMTRGDSDVFNSIKEN